MRSRNDDKSERQRAQRCRARTAAGALRRCAADESGSASIEYLLVTMTCGLLVAIGLIAAIGPSLVSMWSDRRACLYDAVCLSPLHP
jgi:Flp pilus assembly pilin Flp